jgi:tetratricopeptide (TPR) repeat protein
MVVQATATRGKMATPSFGPAEWLSLLNILVAFLGVCFVVLGFAEWFKLRHIRKEMRDLESRISKKLHASFKASHRVMASYGLKDPDSRISLLESAAQSDPAAFNLYNALGYAYLDKGDTQSAIDAFSQAVLQHPDDKAGYCDLAYGHLRNKNQDLCLRYLRKAISVDPTARDDILGDSRFADVRTAL